MKNATTTSSLCPRLSFLAIPIGVGAALSVSNGPAVGVAIGAALAIILSAARR
jgi:hypothetical protein